MKHGIPIRSFVWVIFGSLLTGSFNRVDGFTFTFFARGLQKRPIPVPLFRATIIYAPSEGGGWDEEYCGLDDDDDDVDDVENGLSTEKAALMNILSKDHMVALARLAVAFSPAGAAIDLRHIEAVQVLGMDELHIDIQAVVCEEDGCVTLAVPVMFPHPCDTRQQGLEECVLGNIGELDVQAETVLRTIEWEESHYEDIQADSREWQVLLSTTDLHFPVWWTQADASDFRDECQSIRSLLNEDSFQYEIRALVDMVMTESINDNSDSRTDTDDDNSESWTVKLAAVAAVGPAGIIIRASTQRLELFEELPTKRIVEVPIAFREIANDVADLRAAVLGSIAAAGDYVENS